MRPRKYPLPDVQYDTFALRGGLDLVTPILSLKPGSPRDSINVEVHVTGAHTRVAGYVRFDGTANPNLAAWTPIPFVTSPTTVPPAGATISNGTSTATASIISFSGNVAIVRPLTGSFSVGDAIVYSAATIGTVGATPPSFSPTTDEINTYTLAARDQARAFVLAVPGSGPVRGIGRIGSTIYAWRDNAGATAKAIYKSTNAGWVAVPALPIISFSTGVSPGIAEGATINNGAGATAVVRRVALDSGSSWAGASGRLVVDSVVGTWAASNPIRVGTTVLATATSAPVAPTIPPGGRVEVVLGNVYGYSGRQALYGADGVGKGFEFDGVSYLPINTGMADDTPDHVAVHKRRLFFSFGASVQFSAVANPCSWSVVLGAGEIAVRAPVTALQILPGNEDTGALGIFTYDSSHILYGSTDSNFQLIDYERGAGAEPYSVQVMEQVYTLDRAGISSMTASQAYGNFDTKSLTFPMRPFTQARRGTCTASGVSRDKSQYRVFYPNGYAVFSTIVNGRPLGSMPVQFPTTVRCWTDGEVQIGSDVSFFGGEDGFVYQMETGDDFDGVGVSFFVRYNHVQQGNHRIYKRYRQLMLELLGDNYAEFQLGYSLGFDEVRVDQPLDRKYAQLAGQAGWDSNAVWDEFAFDLSLVSPVEVECHGTAETIQIIVRGDSRICGSFTINTATLHYSVRRGMRGV